MKIIYLACAYSDRSIFGKWIMMWRTRRITKIAAKILGKGVNVFSPITHSHYIATMGKLPQLSHEFWLELDKWYVDQCDEVWVYMDLEGKWIDSTGVNREIQWALQQGKEVIGIDDDANKLQQINYIPNLSKIPAWSPVVCDVYARSIAFQRKRCIK